MWNPASSRPPRSSHVGFAEPLPIESAPRAPHHSVDFCGIRLHTIRELLHEEVVRTPLRQSQGLWKIPTIHEVCQDLIIPSTTCRERLVRLHFNDVAKFCSRDKGGIFVSDHDWTLDPALGKFVRIGGIDIPTGMTVHGRLLVDGPVRRRYWHLGDNRDKDWKTLEAHGRESCKVLKGMPEDLFKRGSIVTQTQHKTTANVRIVSEAVGIVMDTCSGTEDVTVIVNEGAFEPLVRVFLDGREICAPTAVESGTIALTSVAPMYPQGFNEPSIGPSIGPPPLLTREESNRSKGRLGEMEDKVVHGSEFRRGDFVVFRTGISYAKLAEKAACGKSLEAITFVSHYWGEEAFGFLATLEKHAATCALDQRAIGDQAYYISAFCDNQHRLCDGNGKSCAFMGALLRVAELQHHGSQNGEAMVALDRNFEIVKRKWCIYELFCCTELDLSVRVFGSDGEMVPGSRSPMASTLEEAIHAVDILRAECSLRRDAELIDGWIKASEHNVGMLNAVVRLALTDLTAVMGSMSISKDHFSGCDLQEVQLQFRGKQPAAVAGRICSTSELIDDICNLKAGGSSLGSRLLIVGDAGTGKSTLSKAIVRHVLKQRQELGDSYSIVAVRIALAEVGKVALDQNSDPKLLFHTWTDQFFEQSKDVRRKTISGKGASLTRLIILDGFEEVRRHRTKVLKWLEYYLRKHSRIRIVVTTRPSGVDPVLVSTLTDARCQLKSSTVQCIDRAHKVLGISTAFSSGHAVNLQGLEPRECYISSAYKGLVISTDFQNEWALQYTTHRNKVASRKFTFKHVDLFPVSGKGVGAKASLKVIENDMETSCTVCVQCKVIQGGCSFSIGDEVTFEHQPDQRVIITWKLSAQMMCSYSSGSLLEGRDWQQEWEQHIVRKENAYDVPTKHNYNNVKLQTLKGRGQGAVANVSVLKNNEPGSKKVSVSVQCQIVHAGECYNVGDDVTIPQASVPEALMDLVWTLQSTQVTTYVTLCRELKDTQKEAMDIPPELLPGAHLEEVSFRRYLTKALGFTNFDIEPISHAGVKQICMNATKEICNSDEIDELLQNMPRHTQETALFAHLLGHRLQMRKDLGLQSLSVCGAVAEIDLLCSAAISLTTQDANHLGMPVEDLIREFSDAALGTLVAGARVINEADMSDLVFKEACAGRLNMFESVGYGSHVQFFNLRFAEYFAAVAWRRRGMSVELASMAAARNIAFFGLLQNRFFMAMEDDEVEGRLSLDFTNHARELDHDGFSLATAAVPSSAVALRLDCSSCGRLTNPSLTALSACVNRVHSLTALDLSFAYCHDLDSSSFAQLAEILPLELRSLHLNFAACKLNHDVVTVLAERIGGMRDLRELGLDVSLCVNVGDDSLCVLAVGLSDFLTDLALNFKECSKLSNTGVVALAERLPSSLRRLSLQFAGCSKIDDDGAKLLRKNLPQSLETVRVFLGRTSVTLAVKAHFVDVNVTMLPPDFGEGLHEESETWPMKDYMLPESCLVPTGTKKEAAVSDDMEKKVASRDAVVAAKPRNMAPAGQWGDAYAEGVVLESDEAIGRSAQTCKLQCIVM